MTDREKIRDFVEKYCKENYHNDTGPYQCGKLAGYHEILSFIDSM